MIRVERTEQEGRWLASIMLHREAKRNALTPSMLTELTAAVLRAGEVGDAILLGGDGPVFCAGFDLEMAQSSPDGAVLRLLLSGLSDACRALRRHDRPVVIAAQGAAIAGGCALLGGADIVVSDRHATLGYPVVKLGISPAVSVPFLRLGVGDGQARCRTLRPETFPGEEAHRIGLVHELVDEPSAVLDRARTLAWELAQKPAEAIRATKAWLGRLEETDQNAAIDAALEASLGLTGGAEERERLGTLRFGAPTQDAPQ